VKTHISQPAITTPTSLNQRDCPREIQDKFNLLHQQSSVDKISTRINLCCLTGNCTSFKEIQRPSYMSTNFPTISLPINLTGYLRQVLNVPEYTTPIVNINLANSYALDFGFSHATNRLTALDSQRTSSSVWSSSS
jgi:hypothetical protein